MDLIAISIRRPVFAWILMSAMIIFGAILANRLGVSQLPDVDFPILTVSVTYEGAAPEVVEAELIEEIDPDAFVAQSSVIGVYGQGFDRIKRSKRAKAFFKEKTRQLEA